MTVGLGTIGRPESVAVLLVYLDAPKGADSVPRAEAVKLLGRVGDAGARPTLEQMGRSGARNARAYQ